MTLSPHHRSNRMALGRSLAGFGRIDALALIACFAVTVFLAAPLWGAALVGSRQGVCRQNLRRLIGSYHLYAADHRGVIPQPTLGSDVSGPGGWAYAVTNEAAAPGEPAMLQSASGRDARWARRFQGPFLKLGQVWDYVGDEESYLCPEDVARWDREPYRRPFLTRPWKLSSYTANIVVAFLSGSDAQLGRFRGDDILMWETDESDGFYFNNAATFPYERTTVRHDGLGHWARADASVEAVTRSQHVQEEGRPRRNRLYCNPQTFSGDW